MTRKKTTEEYVAAAKVVHGGTYAYDRLVYNGAGKPVVITCKIHGDVKSNSTSHLSGSGCYQCAHTTRGAKRLEPIEVLISKAIEVHGHTYDYSLTKQAGNQGKIDIICKTHGVFSTTPAAHKRGVGCTGCAGYGFQKTKPGFFYVLVAENMCKVGITNRPVEARLNKLNRAKLGFKIYWASYSLDGCHVFNLEKRVLAWLKSTYKQPDGTFDGYTETFLDVDIDRLMDCIVQEGV